MNRCTCPHDCPACANAIAVAYQQDMERNQWERRAQQAETSRELERIRHQYQTRRRVL